MSNTSKIEQIVKLQEMVLSESDITADQVNKTLQMTLSPVAFESALQLAGTLSHYLNGLDRVFRELSHLKYDVQSGDYGDVYGELTSWRDYYQDSLSRAKKDIFINDFNPLIVSTIAEDHGKMLAFEKALSIYRNMIENK